MKHILLCTLLAVVAAATMECPGAVPEDASGKFWTQDNGGGDLGPLVQAHRGRTTPPVASPGASGKASAALRWTSDLPETTGSS